MTITLRTNTQTGPVTATTKGSALTHAELDSNFQAFAASDGSGSSNVTFIQPGTGAVATDLQTRERQFVWITDFAANGVSGAKVDPTGVVDSVAGIQAAITYAKTFAGTQTEIALLWPAGTYNFNSAALDYTGANRIVNIAIGSVVINGTQVGGTSIIKADGSSGTTPTTRVHWIGNFTVEITGSGTYAQGVKLNTCTSWRIENMAISGDFSNAALDISYSWDNYLFIIPTNTHAAGALAVNCSDGNVNKNEFFIRGSCAAGVGKVISVQGLANRIAGDFNTALTGIELNGALGTVIVAPYFEATVNCITTTGNPIGTTVLGGEYEIGTGGAAFDLSSSQATTIISPRVKGVAGGNTRTFVKLGTAAYLVSIIDPNLDGTVDTVSTGTWRGATGGAAANSMLQAQWLSFPSTQISSSDANTLDDYAEGTWTPVLTNVTPGDLAITYSAQQGYYTKVGRLVTVNFFISTSSFTHTTSAGVYRITGLPYLAANIANNESAAAILFGGITKTNYTQVQATIDANTQLIYLTASGSGQAYANVVAADMPSGGTVNLIGTLTYLAAT